MRRSIYFTSFGLVAHSVPPFKPPPRGAVQVVTQSTARSIGRHRSSDWKSRLRRRLHCAARRSDYCPERRAGPARVTPHKPSSSPSASRVVAPVDRIVTDMSTQRIVNYGAAGGPIFDREREL